jgi:hypothetical protein
VVGHPVPAGLAKGQQTATQVVALLLMVAVAVLPLTVSVSVPVHGAFPISKVEFAGSAVSVTVPSATQAVMSAPVDAVPPATLTEHQASKFFTVSDTGVDPLQPPVPPPLPPLPPLPALPPLPPGADVLLHPPRATLIAITSTPAHPTQLASLILFMAKPPCLSGQTFRVGQL